MIISERKQHERLKEVFKIGEMTDSNTREYTPYLACANVLATWMRIKLLLVIILFCIIILFGLSGYTAEAADGGYSKIDSDYSNWQSKACEASPMLYLRPFSFHFTSGATKSVTVARCPWPVTESAYRLTVACVSFLIVISLFIKTILSRFGRSILLLFSLLYFASFILDTNQTIIGFDTCRNNFKDTPLGNSLSSHGVTITCYSNFPGGVVFFDLVISLLFYLAFECWGMCPNLYNGTAEFSAIKDVEIGAPVTKNPMLGEQQEEVDYTPYEKPHDPSQYMPYEGEPHDASQYAPNEVPSKPPPPIPGAGHPSAHGNKKDGSCFLF